MQEENGEGEQVNATAKPSNGLGPTRKAKGWGSRIE